MPTFGTKTQQFVNFRKARKLKGIFLQIETVATYII